MRTGKNIKENLHKLIDEIDDKEILNSVFESLEVYQTRKKNKGDVTDELTSEQLTRLELAIQQAKNGQTIPDAVVRERIRKWFTK